MNKSEEKTFVKVLFSKLKLEPIILTDFEEPDFLFSMNNQQYGIEVTRIFQINGVGDVLLQAQDSERNLIVENAKSNYNKKNELPNLDVAVLFGRYPQLNKKNRNVLSQKILDFIIKYTPNPDKSIWIDNDFNNLNEFPEEIAHIRISNFSFLEKNHWHVPTSGFIQTTFIKELQEIIDKKNLRLDSYHINCTKCWLLVVADSKFSSSFFEPDEDTIKNKYSSNFDRAFCMWDWYGDYFKIKST